VLGWAVFLNLWGGIQHAAGAGACVMRRDAVGGSSSGVL
jgi:hypothetical protein